MRHNDESPLPGSKPSLLTYAQRAEADRNRVAPNLQGASATKLERRLLAQGGSTLGVLALLAGAGAGVWRSHSDSADQKPINVAGALPGLSGKPVPLAGVPAAEVVAVAPAATIYDEAPARPDVAPENRPALKDMPSAGPAQKAGGDVLSKALEAPAPAAAKTARNGRRMATKPKLKKVTAKSRPRRRTEPKSTQELDSDVNLLAALMAHDKAHPELKNAAPSLQAQLQQYQKMNRSAAEHCHLRVCAGLTKTHVECEPAKVAAKAATTGIKRVGRLRQRHPPVQIDLPGQ